VLFNCNVERSVARGALGNVERRVGSVVNAKGLVVSIRSLWMAR